MAPPADYPYNNSVLRAPFNDVLAGSNELGELGCIVLHDAVLNTASVWKDVWTRVAKLD